MAPSFREFLRFLVLAALASLGAGLAASVGAWAIGL
jgi:hypothetical protein